MKRLAIVQSNYIPWKGYFDLIGLVDEFLLYDEVQFTKRDWRNRNQIKTAQGPQWLTIPVVSKGRFLQTIAETEIAAPWTDGHWRAITHAYARAPHFDALGPRIAPLYERAATMGRLSEVNRLFLTDICALLDIHTPIRLSSEYSSSGAKSDRLISLCQAAGATHYLSGPSARAYIEPEKFAAAGIALEYMDYSGYPVYPQLFGAFAHGVTVLDLIFNTGPEARRFMKS